MTMVDLLFRGRRLVFETALGNREVTERLQREVAPPRWGARETRTQLFEGTFLEGRFRMVRLVRGRHSFRPVIEGTVVTARQGARVEVCLQLHPLVLGLIAVLVGIGALVVLVAAGETAARGEAAPLLLVAPGMALAGAGILAIASLEAGRATRLLERLLDAKPSIRATTAR